MYLWTFYLSKKGHIIDFYHKEVDALFIKEHPWIPRIWWKEKVLDYADSACSHYLDPEFEAQFFCNDIDIDVIARIAFDMWRHYIKLKKTDRSS